MIVGFLLVCFCEDYGPFGHLGLISGVGAPQKGYVGLLGS